MPSKQEPEELSGCSSAFVIAVVITGWLIVIQGLPILIIFAIPILIGVGLLFLAAEGIKAYDKYTKPQDKDDLS